MKKTKLNNEYKVERRSFNGYFWQTLDEEFFFNYKDALNFSKKQLELYNIKSYIYKNGELMP